MLARLTARAVDRVHVDAKARAAALAADDPTATFEAWDWTYYAERDRSARFEVDDSRLRLADDLDIAPDGRVFFSEATVRYEMHEWPVDGLESRGNGRISERTICVRR